MISPTESFEDIIARAPYVGRFDAKLLPTEAAMRRDAAYWMSVHGLTKQPEEMLGQCLVLPTRDRERDISYRSILQRTHLYSAVPFRCLDLGIRYHMHRIAHRFGRGRVWFLDAPVHFIRTADEDSVRFQSVEKDGEPLIMMRSMFGHEQQLVPKLPLDTDQSQRLSTSLGTVTEKAIEELRKEYTIANYPAFSTKPLVIPGDELRALRRFTEEQHAERPSTMTAHMREIGRAEWSRQLREKLEASKERERNQVLCDWQDEP